MTGGVSNCRTVSRTATRQLSTAERREVTDRCEITDRCWVTERRWVTERCTDRARNAVQAPYGQKASQPTTASTTIDRDHADDQPDPRPAAPPGRRLPALRPALVDEGAEHLSGARRVVIALGTLGAWGLCAMGQDPSEPADRAQPRARNRPLYIHIRDARVYAYGTRAAERTGRPRATHTGTRPLSPQVERPLSTPNSLHAGH